MDVATRECEGWDGVGVTTAEGVSTDEGFAETLAGIEWRRNDGGDG